MKSRQFHLTPPTARYYFLDPWDSSQLNRRSQLYSRGKKTVWCFSLLSTPFISFSSAELSFFVMVDRPSEGRRALLNLSKQVNQWSSEKYMFTAGFDNPWSFIVGGLLERALLRVCTMKSVRDAEMSWWSTVMDQVPRSAASIMSFKGFFSEKCEGIFTLMHVHMHVLEFTKPV